MTEEVRNAKLIITNYKRGLYFDVYKQQVEFRKKIDYLISTTPTGEDRNNLTDINILFESIVEKYENLLKLNR